MYKRQEFYIYFSKDTVAKAAEMFFKRSNQTNATLEHSQPIDGMTVFESWIVDSPEFDKSKQYGLDVPAGTWMVSMKVDSKEIWDNYIKNNKVFGFSIEGAFSNVLRSDKAETMDLSDHVLDGALDLIRTFIKDNIN